MKEIQLTQGKVALVDDADFEFLSQWKWCAQRSDNLYYASRKISLDNGKTKTFRMHREIMRPPDNLLVDHKNGNTLDNRRENLRICTNQENCMNSSLPIDNKSGFKGVHLDRSKWRSRIVFNGKPIHLGMFDNPRDAGMAYNKAAIKYFGDFAKLNKI
jgi:hypothetical protein